jgi:outer membrane biosynthesis protein TonB
MNAAADIGLRKAAALVVVLLIVVLIGSYAWSLFKDRGTAKKPSVQTIAVLRPPPPPPPPKPPEKPPEVKKEAKLPDPPKQAAPKPDANPPDKPVSGLDQKGGSMQTDLQQGAWADPRDTRGSGGDGALKIGGADRNVEGQRYAQAVARDLEKRLRADSRLHGRVFRVGLMVWVARDGRLERYEVSETSGNAETDELLRRVLADVGTLGTPPDA